MMAVTRYMVGRAADQVPVAFKNILELCKSRGISRVTLVVPQKRSWDTTIAAQFLGKAVAKALLKGHPVHLAEGVNMTLESVQTFQRSVDQSFLVGVHIAGKDMNKLDDAFGAKAIMYLPWNDTEGEEWQAIWNPENFSPNAQTISSSSLPKSVEEALRGLTEVINLGTGLTHPSDRELTERTIDRLLADGHLLDHVDMRRWAQRNGWSSGAAVELAAIVKKRG